MPKLVAPPKLPRGFGNIQLAEGRGGYFARLFVGRGLDGKQRFVSRLFVVADYRSPQAAIKAATSWLAEQKGLHDGGRRVEPSRLTVAAWIDEYLEEVAASRAPKTYATYRELLGRFAVPHLGRIRLVDLSPLHIQRFVAQIRTETSAAMTWKALHYLRMCLNRAWRLELIERNPAAQVRIAKPQTTKLTRWSVEECRKALEWAKPNKTLYTYLYLGLVTGMRREELIGLRWSNVHLDVTPPYIDVVQAISYVSRKWHVGPTKTKQSRSVYIDDATAQVLREHRQFIDMVRRRYERRKIMWHDYDLVMPAQHGEPLKPQWLYRWFSRIAVGAAITKIRPYDLRSTYASLTEGKLTETVAAARAGHSTTVRRAHYLRTVREQQQAAALPLEALLDS